MPSKIYKNMQNLNILHMRKVSSRHLLSVSSSKPLLYANHIMYQDKLLSGANISLLIAIRR